MAGTIDRPSGNARLPAAAQDVDAMDCQFRGSACGERSADHEAASSPKPEWPGEPFASRAAAAAAASPLNCVRKGSPPALVQANLADRMVPHERSVMLPEPTKRVGSPMRLDLVPDAKQLDPVFDKLANLAVVASFLDAASAHGEDRVVATQTGH